MKKLPLFIFTTIVVAVTAGIQSILLFFDLPVFIIVVGFRFHLALLIPIIFYIFRLDFTPTIESLKNLSFKGLSFGIMASLLALIIILGFLFFTKNISYKEPVLLYELGLSSIADYPIYLIWNIVGIFLSVSYMKKLYVDNTLSYFSIFAIVVMIFSPELIKNQLSEFNYISIIELFISISIFSLLIHKFNSIYTISILMFTIFWIGILLFGTEIPTLVKLFLGNNYTSWDGFFLINKNYETYSFLAYLLIVLIIISFKRRERKI